MTLDELDPLPPLGRTVPPPQPEPAEEWEHIPGEPVGIDRNRITGKHRNIDTGPMLEWPFGVR